MAICEIRSYSFNKAERKTKEEEFTVDRRSDFHIESKAPTKSTVVRTVRAPGLDW